MTRDQLNKYFDDFLAEFDNMSVDFDGYYGAQCVDLVQSWSWYIGGPRFYGDYAYEIFGQGSPFYESIPNTPDAVMQKGDIVVWEKKYNGYAGHTADATGNGKAEGKDTDWFEAFSQNDPTGSVSKVRRYSFRNVKGWLRPKVSNSPTYMPKQISDEQLAYYQDMEKKGKEFEKLTQQHGEWKTAKDVLDYEHDANEKFKKKDGEIDDLKERLELQKSNHELELAEHDRVCQAKIEEIKNIPPKVEIKTVEVPREGKNAIINWLIQSLFSLDELVSSGKIK